MKKLALGDHQKRVVLIVCILASFVAFLDGSVVNVALPAIARELGGGLVTQQWVVDAYLITLGSLILIAGSLSDLFGRKRVMLWGLIGFGLTSILCALAPTGGFLIGMRAVQGVAGALLVPSSLAMIISVFSGPEQGKAIGTWTAWTGIAFIIGPLLGGLLIDTVSWRLIFAINVLPISVTLWLLQSLFPTERPNHGLKIDRSGAVWCAVGLGGPVYALIEQSRYGWASPLIYLPLTIGLAGLVYFIWHEQHTPEPMLPLGLFKIRNFGIGNISTLAIYGGLSIATFMITIFIQEIGGYTAIEAGLALLPVTLIMFFFSPKFGGLAGRYGPRLFMTIGPLVCAAGFLCMLRVNQSVIYWSQLFPGILLFGFGLAATVAPLTTAILGSIDSRQAGIASAINNAVARIAGLIATAAIGIIIGTKLGVTGFHQCLLVLAVLLATGGVVSYFGIQNPRPTVRSVE